MKKIKFKFNKNIAGKFISVILKYRYLFFFIFFSASLALTFEFMYKYIYANANFSEYEESYESQAVLGIKTNDRILKEILKNIEQRRKKLEEKDANFNNPFEFMDYDILEINEDNDINIDNDFSDDENNNSASPLPLNIP